MIRVLVLIAVAGFVVCILSIGGAVGLGGRDMLKNGWHVPSWWHSDGNYDGDRSPIDWSGPTATREMQWDGEDHFSVAVPADVSFTQGPVAKMTVSGPQGAIDRLVLNDGRLRFEHNFYYGRNGGPRLQVTLTAPDVTRFDLMGTGRMNIADYNHDELEAHIAGSGDVIAKGTARRVQLKIAGSGDGDFGDMVSDETEVTIAGSGNAVIAPKERAEIHIAGSGDITLLSQPKDMETHIAGSGKIIHGAPRVPGSTPTDALAPVVPAPPAAPAAAPAVPAAPAAPAAPPAKATKANKAAKAVTAT